MEGRRLIHLGIFGILVLCGMVSGQAYVHFDDLTPDCSANSTLIGQCNFWFDYWYQQSPDLETDCQLFIETIACIETALCHCNYSVDHNQLEYGWRSTMVYHHYYNNLTQCGNQTYADSIQNDVLGPIDVDSGINCTEYNKTTGQLAVTLAVAQLPPVTAAEALCLGIQACYNQFDRSLEQALFYKNWGSYCDGYVMLIDCLVNATCRCNQTLHLDVVSLVETERSLFVSNCGTVRPGLTFQENGISCPGSDICKSPDPHYNCLNEYDIATDSDQTLPGYCNAVLDLANCTERLACECGFYQEPSYYRSLAIANYNYGPVSGCVALTGPFPNHTGYKCADDGRFTEEEKILTITLAEPSFVNQENARCPGIQRCYDIANVQAARAHMMKDFQQICQVESDRIVCIEEAYCQCNLLFDDNVFTRMYNERVNHAQLCYGVVDFIPLTRCRGQSTCSQNSPLDVCYAEYSYDYTTAGNNLELICEGYKQYIVCAEEVGCACGMLADGSSAEAAAVYNFTTFGINNYVNASCPRLTGSILPTDDGIACQGVPVDQQTAMKLTLAYAESNEVAALATGCAKVQDCFASNDIDRATALTKRSFMALCESQKKLLLCVDNEYCQCSLNGTTKAENYIGAQLALHNSVCSHISPFQRAPCVRGPTGGVERSYLSLASLLVAIVLAFSMS